MQIFTAAQIRELDAQTISQEPISSIDLMERAAEALFQSIAERSDKYGTELVIFAGRGNNGGDALALARLLTRVSAVYDLSVYLMGGSRSVDCEANYERLKECADVSLHVINEESDCPNLTKGILVIDGLLGTGLSRPVQGLYAHVIDVINSSNTEVISIDIPSGMLAEDNKSNFMNIVKANKVLSLQFPKLAFMLNDSASFVQEWEVLDIGLYQAAIENMPTPYALVDYEMIKALQLPRGRFSHKGTFGHALLVSGKKTMMGAAVLAAKSCLRSGVGMVTVHVPLNCGTIIQNVVPEAIISTDRSELMFTDVPILDTYNAVGVGPGIGTKPNSQYAFFEILKENSHPSVLDADALNILAQNKDWLNNLSSQTVLTPHPKEFDRLTHLHDTAYDRLMTQIAVAKEWKVVIVLKGAYTSVVLPDGRCFFNTTGNHGMATAGSGDVLTGIILGLLSQGYTATEAALIGVWWHGKAGDLYAEKFLPQTMIASDIIEMMRYVAFS